MERKISIQAICQDFSFGYILSPRLDRKIEFPAPTEEARARIMQIHARKMNVDPDVNYEELARF